MKLHPDTHLRRWECALLIAFALVLTLGCWASASETALAAKVLRLHVIANSDTPEDQALKLQVRDAVLEAAEPWLEHSSSRAMAEAAISPHLPELEQVARAVLAEHGNTDPVSVSLEDVWFPTRHYDTFSLPAGSYRALRVVIGQGEGQNWWCVMFPPLCMGAVSEEAATVAGLTEDQLHLIAGRDGEYVLKFKVVEWWEELLHQMGWDK